MRLSPGAQFAPERSGPIGARRRANCADRWPRVASAGGAGQLRNGNGREGDKQMVSFELSSSMKLIGVVAFCPG